MINQTSGSVKSDMKNEKEMMEGDVISQLRSQE